MNKKMKLSLAIASLLTAAPLLRAEEIGLTPASVNTWLAGNGYATQPAADAVTAKRRKLIELSNGGKPVDAKQADEQISEHLIHLHQLFPTFDSYPVYLQDSLLDADLHGDFAAGESDPTVRTINTENWVSAAAAYHDRPEFSETESFFAAKDAYDATGTRDTPEAKDLMATMDRYASRSGHFADLQRMQMNELAFLRFARENDIDRTWKRAVVIGSEGFAPGNAGDVTSAYGANRGLIVADYNDYLNRQNRGNQPTGGTSAPAAPPFAFTVPNSTNGFSDITVNRKTPFTFTLLDRHIVDGDIQAVTFVNGKGSQINQTITLTGSGQSFTVRVAKGANELRIFAQNQGTLGVNSGGLRIGSPVVTGAVDQDVSLLTGQTGILRVTGR